MFEIREHKYDGNRLYFVGNWPQTNEDRWNITIAKWQFLVENPGTDDGGYTTCGHCMKFFDKFDDDACCYGCPIMEDKHPFCWETPYEEYYDKRTKEAAQAELDYLLDLRERCNQDQKD